MREKWIAVTYSSTYYSVDGYRDRRWFRTLKGAQDFAQGWIGATPEIGTSYAVSGDGIGKIRVEGATLTELFPSA